ncbi:hypothetical protein EVAR_49592_1 [Eumeta japonica]|uniref:Uncharacterized protein n=1 Tax=Eumeta variegata TaxID=151549 RepID=A0A4C1ZQF5_EUMVA|nr:hypothetical protein EVAR_49592_1 [Eumeta japonica]
MQSSGRMTKGTVLRDIYSSIFSDYFHLRSNRGTRSVPQSARAAVVGHSGRQRPSICTATEFEAQNSLVRNKKTVVGELLCLRRRLNKIWNNNFFMIFKEANEQAVHQRVVNENYEKSERVASAERAITKATAHRATCGSLFVLSTKNLLIYASIVIS